MSDRTDDPRDGKRLLSVVERIIQSPDRLVARVEDARAASPRLPDEDDAQWARRVAERLISSYSTKAALAGGATALPALLPGGGTLVTLLGGALADMGLVLKLEVELALCLTHLHGFDIRLERERQLAFLLASVGTYEATTERNPLVSLAMAEGTAIWNYTPRQVSKLLLTVVGDLAVHWLTRGAVRALPLVGIVVGGSLNKVLTTRVGHRCLHELEARRRLAGAPVTERDVVRARRRA